MGLFLFLFFSCNAKHSIEFCCRSDWTEHGNRAEFKSTTSTSTITRNSLGSEERNKNLWIGCHKFMLWLFLFDVKKLSEEIKSWNDCLAVTTAPVSSEIYPIKMSVWPSIQLDQQKHITFPLESCRKIFNRKNISTWWLSDLIGKSRLRFTLPEASFWQYIQPENSRLNVGFDVKFVFCKLLQMAVFICPFLQDRWKEPPFSEKNVRIGSAQRRTQEI